MCCFSRPVTHVSGTSIFARTAEAGRQFLVYSMSIEAKEDLAMVLPLPVKLGTDEKGVSFIDLKAYPNFFEDLEKGFPPPHTRGLAVPAAAGPSTKAEKKLEVIQVGDFEASFVPTMKDFARLDERFRLPEGTWKKLPGYSDFGFAVFKLKHGALKVHPMAFSFPRRDTKSLFFPTVHIHDGQVHAKADFDHTLYCQPHENQHLALENWRESSGHASSFVKIDKAKGLVEADQHCYRKQMIGNLLNRDTLLGIEG
jgi:hypothetical protein